MNMRYYFVTIVSIYFNVMILYTPMCSYFYICYLIREAITTKKEKIIGIFG
jgi:hypothetical protein